VAHLRAKGEFLRFKAQELKDERQFVPTLPVPPNALAGRNYDAGLKHFASRPNVLLAEPCMPNSNTIDLEKRMDR